MTPDEATSACPACSRPAPADVLAEAGWLPAEVRERLPIGCPACVQLELRSWLERRAAGGGTVPFDEHHRLVPFGVWPTPLLLGADDRFTGRGVTLALVDSGFYPHPDLADGGRVRAWADVSRPQVRHRFFAPGAPPRWPGWDEQRPSQWHGMMTAAAAAGDGRHSHGWYRGYAPNADLVFVQTWNGQGRITNDAIVRALRWLLAHRERLALRVVNLSIGGDPVRRLLGNAIDRAVGELTDAGVVVVVASGNSGRHRLQPPATAPTALTVGGVDTHNSPDPAAWRLWHGNWGKSSFGMPKPDVLAPSIWVAAPVLPGTATALEGEELFARRDGDPEIEQRIAHHKFITPRYQHVDGTSFASAVTAGVVACLLEANPGLTPAAIIEVLQRTAWPLPEAPAGRQGAGVIQPAAALLRVTSF